MDEALDVKQVASKRRRSTAPKAHPQASAAPAKTKVGEAGTLSLDFEAKVWRRGHNIAAGVDEAGRGPLAGPVVAAAVSILRSDKADAPADLTPPVPGVRDSKLITDESERERLFEALVAHPRVRWGVAAVDPRGIEQINILQGALRSMEMACLDMAGRFEPMPADAPAATGAGAGAVGASADGPAEPDAPMGVYPSYVFVDGNRMPKRFKAMAEEAVRCEGGGEEEDGDGAKGGPSGKAKGKGKSKGNKASGPPEPTSAGAEYADGVGREHSAGALRMCWEQLGQDDRAGAAGASSRGAASGAGGGGEGEVEELLEPAQSVPLPAARLAALSAAPPAGFTAEMVIKGDSKVYSIAAASVIAKVTRDRIMRLIDRKYPEYDLAQHKGYPTPSHKACVVRLGPSPAHRFCFAPIKGRFLWVPEEERGKDGRCWKRAGGEGVSASKAKKSRGASAGGAPAPTAADPEAAGGGGGKEQRTSSRSERAAKRAQAREGHT